MNNEINATENSSAPHYYWLNFGQFIMAFMLLFVGFIVASFITFIEFLVPFDLKPVLQPLTFALPFIFAIGAFYLLFLKPNNLHYNFGFSFSKWIYYPIMALMFLGLMFVLEPIANSIPKSGFGGILDQLWKLMEEMEKLLREYPVSSTFMIVILAPVFEELFFRGLILKGLLNNKKCATWFAIFISSFMFALIHLNPWQFIGAFFLGIVLAVVYYKTQSLLNCMLLHFFNNALSALVFFTSDQMDYAEITNASATESILYGLTLFLIFGYLFLKLTKNHQWKYC